MPYSAHLMTFIFIKPRHGTAKGALGRATSKMLRGAADTWFDVQRLGFDGRPSETMRPTDTCVSTPSLCNANFARS